MAPPRSLQRHNRGVRCLDQTVLHRGYRLPMDRFAKYPVTDLSNRVRPVTKPTLEPMRRAPPYRWGGKD